METTWNYSGQKIKLPWNLKNLLHLSHLLHLWPSRSEECNKGVPCKASQDSGPETFFCGLGCAKSVMSSLERSVWPFSLLNDQQMSNKVGVVRTNQLGLLDLDGLGLDQSIAEQWD